MRRLLILCLAISLAGATGVWSQGLDGWFPMEANRDSDASGNHYNATSATGVVTVTGVRGNADSLDGTSCVLLPDYFNYTGAMSVALWMRQTGGNVMVSSWQDDGLSGMFHFSVNATPKLYCGWAATTILTGKATLTNNVWTHVAMTRGGSPGSWTVSFYVNGKFDTSTTTAVDPAATNPHARIGGYSTSTFYWFKGRIDDVQFYSRALSVRDIRRVMLGLAPIE